MSYYIDYCIGVNKKDESYVLNLIKDKSDYIKKSYKVIDNTHYSIIKFGTYNIRSMYSKLNKIDYYMIAIGEEFTDIDITYNIDNDSDENLFDLFSIDRRFIIYKK